MGRTQVSEGLREEDESLETPEHSKIISLFWLCHKTCQLGTSRTKDAMSVQFFHQPCIFWLFQTWFSFSAYWYGGAKNSNKERNEKSFFFFSFFLFFLQLLAVRLFVI
jgi:hypothetical protein